MKKLIFLLVLFVGASLLFAEEIKVKTGDVFGTSMIDYSEADMMEVME